VQFGPTKATGVVWNSATSITCVTPAASGTGTVDVTVNNADGQTVTKVGAYTYV
jgi:hypothetical protein